MKHEESDRTKLMYNNIYLFMEKIYKIVLWAICSVLLSHNSACVGIATGALEGAIEKQERTNRIESVAAAVGLDQEEFNSLDFKILRIESCLRAVENNQKYYNCTLCAASYYGGRKK